MMTWLSVAMLAVPAAMKESGLDATVRKFGAPGSPSAIGTVGFKQDNSCPWGTTNSLTFTVPPSVYNGSDVLSGNFSWFQPFALLLGVERTSSGYMKTMWQAGDGRWMVSCYSDMVMGTAAYTTTEPHPCPTNEGTTWQIFDTDTGLFIAAPGVQATVN